VTVTCSNIGTVRFGALVNCCCCTVRRYGVSIGWLHCYSWIISWLYFLAGKRG